MTFLICSLVDFNPRSDERSDILSAVTNQIPEISIHAPTNGATPLTIQADHRTCISIHAPTNGATSFGCSRSHLLHHFNPRSDERSDLQVMQASRLKQISIHAPTNGATACPFDIYNPYVFQSTLRRTERLF